MGRFLQIRALFPAVLLLISHSAAAQDWLIEPRSAQVMSSFAESSRLLVRAQESPYDEPMATDRPDFTEASSSVGRGVIQLESGYTFSYDDDELADVQTRTHSGPEILLRYGLTERMEFRLVWNYLWQNDRENGIDTRLDGAEDLVVGTKIELTDEEGWIPESAVILDLSTPTGGNAFTNHHVETGINLLYSWELTEQYSLAASTGHGTSTELLTTFDRHNVFHQSVSLATGLTDRLGGYIEYFGLYFHGRDDNTPENYIDGGFAFQFDNNNQFDIRAGTGLNEAADDFFGGVGMSFRR